MTINIIIRKLCCVKHKTRTAEVTICIISLRLLDRPRQLPHVNSLNSLPSSQSCSRDIEDGLWGRADGWQPKSLHDSIWQGKPVSWGGPGVRPRLPAPVTSREMAQSAGNFSGTKVQFQPRSVHAGVTVVTALSGRRSKGGVTLDIGPSQGPVTTKVQSTPGKRS